MTSRALQVGAGSTEEFLPRSWPRRLAPLRPVGEIELLARCVRRQILSGEKILQNFPQTIARGFFITRIGPIKPTLFDKLDPLTGIGALDCAVRVALPERPISTIKNYNPITRVVPVA